MASKLPDYVASAQPIPQANRVAWYKSTAQTYAGIMLWFVFWQDIPMAGGGLLAQGLIYAFAGLVLAALLCHFLFYLVPGLLGMKTGLPLYIVGTSTYGAVGGFLMPGFLMGLLQFGWLGVNSFFSGLLLVAPFYDSLDAAMMQESHLAVSAVWAIVAAFVGLKGIKYVASVATFLPLIPLAILCILFFKTCSGIPSFEGEMVASLAKGGGLSEFGVVTAMLVYIIGFFATAGAAGADFGMNNRDANDVQLGGLIGIAGATIFAGGMSLLIVAGTLGQAANTVDLPELVKNTQTTGLMEHIMGGTTGAVFMYLLAIAAFPPACFSSFIAANSFKTTLPKINPFISVGAGTAVSIILVLTGKAGNVAGVFMVIGASFGPICGAMMADYLLSGRKWNGPRAGFNPAGWISWVFGFIVGAFSSIPRIEFNDAIGQMGVDPNSPFISKAVDYILYSPVPPLSAFVVGFVFYLILAKLRVTSKTLDMPTKA